MVTRYIKDAFLYGAGDTVVGQVRKANEDNCGYAKTLNGELFVVCDGMGGHVGGATASKIAVDSIISYIKEKNVADKRILLREALLFANMQILGASEANPSLKGMGTTACVVLVNNADIWIAHVGDSRIYLYSEQEKYLYRITKDHSLVQGLVDQGQLDDREAEHHPQKNIILRALGTKPDVEPDVEKSAIKAQVGDVFLICSDGLSGMIDDNQIEAILKEDRPLEDKVQKLIDSANTPDKGKDNITAQLVQVMSSRDNISSHPNFNPKWRQKGNATQQLSSIKQSSAPAQELQANKAITSNGVKRVNKPLIYGIVASMVLVIIAVAGIGVHEHNKTKQKEAEAQLAEAQASADAAKAQAEAEEAKAKAEEAKANADAAKAKADADKAKANADAAKVKADADKAKADADKAKADAAKARAEAEEAKAKAEEAKANADAAKAKADADKAKANADAAKVKADADKAKADADAAKAKADADKAKANADAAKVKADADKAKADADKTKAEAKFEKLVTLYTSNEKQNQQRLDELFKITKEECSKIEWKSANEQKVKITRQEGFVYVEALKGGENIIVTGETDGIIYQANVTVKD